ncbi:unnamed protein product [Phaeothamnion confervicola]
MSATKADAGKPAPLLIRLLMIGDSSVGKTSLVLRYDKRGFNPKFTTTIGVDYSDRLLEIEGRQVKLQIWDTAGQERFHSLTTSFFKRAEGFVMVFDVTNRQSFDNVRRWMNDISEQGKKESDIVVCGNKCDATSRQVSEKIEAATLCKEFQVPYVETSAKENINVDSVFGSLAAKVKNRLDAKSSEEEQRANEVLRLKTGGSESMSSKMDSCCS